MKNYILMAQINQNAMYSLSVLCKLKNLKFDYYVSHLPDILSKIQMETTKKHLKWYEFNMVKFHKILKKISYS